MVQTLKNDLLTVVIDSLGAELQSIIDNRTGYQYLYQGNTKFWGRRSPHCGCGMERKVSHGW